MKHKYCSSEKCTLCEAMQQMDREGVGVIFALDEVGKMVGMLTDGDVRRAILKGVSLSEILSNIMNVNFVYAEESQTRGSQINMMKKIHRRHLPILNRDKQMVDVLLLDDVEFNRNDTPIVLMVGGLGTRLGHLTKSCPKPMLEVGERPILETIINAVSQYGFYKFILSVNFMSHVIEQHFGDGSKWGVEIQYVREQGSLGTAGSLGLLDHVPEKPFFVMNGDVLTRLNFQSLLDYHNEHSVRATVAVRKYENKVPFGVVEHDGSYLVNMKEKPVYNHYVNAGIYILEPSCLNLIPKNKSYDMTDLIEGLIADDHKVAMFPVHEYWRDVGLADELKLAHQEYNILIK